MGKMLGQHEISTIGERLAQAFTGTAARLKLVDDIRSKAPIILVVYSDQDVRIRQGGSAVVADQNDHLLYAETYWVVTIEDADQAYLSVITPTSGTNGTLEATHKNCETPGTDTLL